MVCHLFQIAIISSDIITLQKPIYKVSTGAMITTAIIVILVVVIVVLLLSLLKYACFVWCDVGSKARAAQC